MTLRQYAKLISVQHTKALYHGEGLLFSLSIQLGGCYSPGGPSLVATGLQPVCVPLSGLRNSLSDKLEQQCFPNSKASRLPYILRLPGADWSETV